MHTSAVDPQALGRADQPTHSVPLAAEYFKNILGDRTRIKLLRKPAELIIWFFRRCLFYMIVAECWGHEEIRPWLWPPTVPGNTAPVPLSCLIPWLIFGTQQSWCSDAEDKPKPFLVHSLFTAAAQPNPSLGRRVQLSLSHPGGRLGWLN